jgi:2-iminobutanoate/2-iminopropanoate deaminase
MPSKMWTVGVVSLGLVLAGCSLEERSDRDGARRAEPEASPRREIIQPEGVARLPVFSSAVRSGDFIFLSGSIGALPGVNPPQIVEGGVQAETRQTFENIKTVLAAAGATMEDLIKCTVFLADIADYAAMNEAYLEYFPSDPPARSAMAGSGLALGAKVEIECIAAVPEGS